MWQLDSHVSAEKFHGRESQQRFDVLPVLEGDQGVALPWVAVADVDADVGWGTLQSQIFEKQPLQVEAVGSRRKLAKVNLEKEIRITSHTNWPQEPKAKYTIIKQNPFLPEGKFLKN